MAHPHFFRRIRFTTLAAAGALTCLLGQVAHAATITISCGSVGQDPILFAYDGGLSEVI